MKIHSKLVPLLAIFCLPSLLNAQGTSPSPTGTPSPAVDPVDYQVLRRRVETIEAEEPAPLAGMIPVRKRISITVDEVADPHFPAPAPPPEAVQPDPQALAAFRAKMALRPRRVFIHLSATVYEAWLRAHPPQPQDIHLRVWEIETEPQTAPQAR